MTQDEVEYFEDFFRESFTDILTRELLLSQQEKEYVKTMFPTANIEPFDSTVRADGKMWWVVSFGRLG